MDKYFMRVALMLARRGVGRTNPNPMVGAVIVKDGRIIGQGCHERYGEAHAEVNAFDSASEPVTGATMYVTLEPCSHFGKNPPCTDRIIREGIKRVVVAGIDPNPLVAGQGIRQLEEAGVEVSVGLLEKESRRMNEVFMNYIVDRIPFVVMKCGMSLDGKAATSAGESQWITCRESRKHVHELRNQLASVMVGVGTVIADDPSLTCRIPDGVNPLRVIIDSKLRIPLDAKVMKDQDTAKTVVFTTQAGDREKAEILKKMGVEVLTVDTYEGRVDLKAAVAELGKRKIDSVLLEGGPTLNFSALEQGIVDKAMFYVAPVLFGGKEAKTAVEGKGFHGLSDGVELKNIYAEQIGNDLLIQGYISERAVKWNS